SCRGRRWWGERRTGAAWWRSWRAGDTRRGRWRRPPRCGRCPTACPTAPRWRWWDRGRRRGTCRAPAPSSVPGGAGACTRRQAGREGAPALDPGRMMAHSWGVLGFWLVHLLRRPELLGEAMQDLLAAVLDGSLTPVVGGTYPLAEARRAHEDMRARRTTGKLV